MKTANYETVFIRKQVDEKTLPRIAGVKMGVRISIFQARFSPVVLIRTKTAE
jgi:hypothetical protein